MKPTVGRIVHYTSKHGDGVVSPAVVLRTRDSTVPDGTASGVTRPDGLVAELPDDTTLDLLVHGLGGDYREYAVPQSPTPDTGCWNWPPRDPAPEPVTHGRYASDC